MPAITYDGENHTAAYSPVTRDLEDEDALYSTLVNTPYTSHNDFIANMGFDFYTKKMNGTSKTKRDIFTLLALGRFEINGTFNNIGKYGYYWSATKWTISDGATNTRNYYMQIGYSDGSSNFEAVMPNTITSYGMPVLPMVGN